MIDLKYLIPSGAIRQQCIKENRVFDLREEATLIWNNPELVNYERLALLEDIVIQAKNNPQWKDLCNQIKERIDKQGFLKEKFNSYEDKQYYKISYRDRDSKRIVKECRLFSKVEYAQKYIREELFEFCLNGEYTITKGYLDFVEEISMIFNQSHTMMDLYSSSDSEEWNKDRFEYAYVSVPYPFRDGDIVHTIGCDEVGIFRGCKNDEEYQKDVEFKNKRNYEGYLDYSDVSCKVEFPEKDTKNDNRVISSHHHPYLINLVYGVVKEDNPYYELLKEREPVSLKYYVDFYLNTLNELLKDEVLYELNSSDTSGYICYVSDLLNIKNNLSDTFKYLEGEGLEDYLQALLSFLNQTINYLSKFRPIIRVDAHYRKLYQEILDLLNEHYFELKSQLY